MFVLPSAKTNGTVYPIGQTYSKKISTMYVSDTTKEKQPVIETIKARYGCKYKVAGQIYNEAIVATKAAQRPGVAVYPNPYMEQGDLCLKFGEDIASYKCDRAASEIAQCTNLGTKLIIRRGDHNRYKGDIIK